MTMLLSYAGWEDEPWVERVPRLLEPMGIRSVRASTGRVASEVIRTTPVHIAVVDLGMPLDTGVGGAGGAGGQEGAEGGARLLELLGRLSAPPPTLVVKRSRGTREETAEITAALRAGAFAVLDRPRTGRDLELFLELLRRMVQRHYRGRWPGRVR